MREIGFGLVCGLVMAVAALLIAAWPVPGRPIAAFFPAGTASAEIAQAVTEASGSLLQIEARRVEEPAAREALKITQTRINAIALAHRSRRVRLHPVRNMTHELPEQAHQGLLLRRTHRSHAPVSDAHAHARAATASGLPVTGTA